MNAEPQSWPQAVPAEIVESPEWSRVVDARASIGEIPIWSVAEQALYWIDIYEPALYRSLGPAGTDQKWRLPAPIGCYCLTEDGCDAIVALKTGLFRLDLRDGTLTPVHPAPYDVTQYRFNDGRCDRQGRFWVGSSVDPDEPARYGSAAFWRLDQNGFACRLAGLSIANGIGFSPDSSRMYVADRPNWQILCFDFDAATGEATNRRTFTPVPTGWIPDGAAVDAEGGYWLAIYGQGRILRFHPDGRLDRALAAPTRYPTMVSFGGPDLCTMFVTTARAHVPPDELSDSDDNGALFSTRLAKPGLVEPLFAGPRGPDEPKGNGMSQVRQ